LNNWNKINKVDENYATYFNWKLQQIQNINIDLGRVEAMCLKCPLTDGSVVIAAQSLYNSITNEHRLFDNSCGTSNGVGARQIVQIDKNSLETTSAIAAIYPSPAKNFINVVANNMQQAVLSDISGKQLQIQKAIGSTVSFGINNLTPGLYFIKIIDNKGNASIQKFVKE
jgi:hypothetical protein